MNELVQYLSLTLGASDQIIRFLLSLFVGKARLSPCISFLFLRCAFLVLDGWLSLIYHDILFIDLFKLNDPASGLDEDVTSVTEQFKLHLRSRH